MSKSLLSKLQDALHDHTDEPAVAVPQLVTDFADLVHSQGNPDEYKELSCDTALILRHFGVSELPEDAPQRFLTGIPTVVLISSRVDRAVRAYFLEEPEHLRNEAQFLWQLLEARCKEYTGKTFKELLEV